MVVLTVARYADPPTVIDYLDSGRGLTKPARHGCQSAGSWLVYEAASQLWGRGGASNNSGGFSWRSGRALTATRGRTPAVDVDVDQVRAGSDFGWT